MSFNTDPSLYEYAVAPNLCLACYDAVTTPKTVFACFSGIKIGAAWGPPLPPAPNGIYELTAIAACLWELNIGVWRIRADLRFGVSILEIWDIPLTWAFLKNTGVPCSTHFTNNLVNGRAAYYLGWGIVVPPLTGGAFSEQNLLELFNIDPASEVWATPRPLAGQISVHSLQRGSDATNVKIKFDHV